MHRIVFAIALAIASIGVAGVAKVTRGTSAQDAAGVMAEHPIVGTWIVDTNTDLDTDPPEVGIFTSDGTVFGLGSHRWVSGAWEAADDSTAAATMVGVFDANGGGYVVLRGPHVVDETGDAWTCDCTFTVVGADGTVLDSGSALASAKRVPVQGVDLAGTALEQVPIWTPVMPEATPAP